MFSTRPNRRSYVPRTRQETTSPPPSGSDSYYGVRSLDSSVCSEEYINDATSHSTTPAQPVNQPSLGAADAISSQTISTPSPDTLSEGSDTTPMIDYAHLPETPSSPISSIYPDTPASPPSTTEVAPPSPDDTLHPLDRTPEGTTRNNNKIELHRRLSLAQLPNVPTLPSSPNTDFSPPDHEGPSAPSSPASIAFSCIASLSSVSRASSPVSGIGYPHHPVGLGIGEGEDDLVLPTMSLPSSSLHMSLPKFKGDVGGIKIGVVGKAESIQELVSALEASDQLDLVDVGKGLIGVARDGELLVTLVTSTSLELVQRRVNDGYEALDELLNPALPHGRQDQIKKLAREHSSENDWIHLVMVLDQDQGVLDGLVEIAPIVTTFDTSLPVVTLKGNESRTTESRAPTPSPPRVSDGPTPMPALTRADSYFTRKPDSPANSPSLELLLRAINSTPSISDASIEQFIAWRGIADSPTPLHSSFTSTSPSVSSYEARHPMPTVARAQGGKQWEADGSRRIASERERKSRRRYSNRHVERPKRPEKEKCGPSLFPKGTPSSSPRITSTGLGNAALGIWGVTKRWKWGIMAAAAVVLVGWSWEYWARAR